MKIITLILFLALAPSILGVPSFSEPLQIIQEEGQFIFHDGSSYYLLKKDGTFRSGPLGIQGRTISGRWEKHDRFFVIKGRWGWINGLSPRNDYRKLTFQIGTPTSVETVKQLSFADGEFNVKVYNCYFMIEELVKVEKSQGLDK